jgi:peroxiredoxin/mono/diheme cytochrome c family protein
MESTLFIARPSCEKSMIHVRCLAALTLALLSLPALAVEPLTVAPFTLPDTSGNPVSPLAAKDQKALVVVFIGTECPISNAGLPRLAEISHASKDRGVGFVAVNSNQQDSTAEVAAHARKHQVPFPVLKDEKNVVADKFGAKRVPEAFLLDAAGTIRYRGRIDDQFGIGIRRPTPTRRDLAEAIDELLAGKPVSVAVTEVAGCLISRVAERPRGGAATVTYTQHVAAILDRRCVDCHHEGQIGPMSLRTYESASAWSGAIEEAVHDNRMPPWHAGPGFGPFANDRRLTPDERKTLLSWIEQGCARGEGQPPRGREFVEGWSIGKPDVVFEMSRPCEVPAKAPRGVPYLYFSVDTNFEEDRWVQAAQVRPGAREVVHHVIVYILKPGERRTAGEDGIGNGFLVSFAPGDKPFECPEGSAKRIPKGSRLVFQMHYTPNGRAQTDRTSVGLIFAKEPPKQEVKVRAIAARRLSIPAGADDYLVHSQTTFRQDVLLLTMSPHMHLRGKSFQFQAVYPDGSVKELLGVPKYDFNWQTTYHLKDPIRLPAGTRIECTAHFDNSASNANNPDPNKTVKWGEQTWDEMMIGFVDYVPLSAKP